MENNYFNNEFYYFILIAEESSLSKAAEKAFVSQQALSKYLAKLEQKCETKLFYRKPVFSLTPAGRVLLERAKQIQYLTDAATDEIKAVKSGKIGQIRLGMGKERLYNVIPPIIETFLKKYPNVDIQICTGSTSELREKVLNGKLDFAFGVSPEEHDDLSIIPLAKESLYLAITDNMLRRYFPEEYPACKTRFHNNIDLHEFSHIPFAINRKTNNINKEFLRYLSDRSIQLKFTITTDGNGINLLLCNSVCCFCMGFLLPYVRIINQALKGVNEINLFPIQELKDCQTLTVMVKKNAKIQPHINYFIQLLAQYISNENYILGNNIWPIINNMDSI